MNIGVIVALKDELAIDKKLVKNFKAFKRNNLSFESFEYQKHKIILIYSGVGKTNASHCATVLVNNYKLDLVINIGSAGGLDKESKISDIVIPNNLYYLDVDASAFGYELGQVPREKEFYKVNSRLVKMASEVFKQLGINVLNSSLGTSDTFITKNNFDKFKIIKNKNISCSDMEGTSIIHVLDKYKINSLFIKIISDSIYEKNSSNKWKEEVIKIKENSFVNLLKIIEGLDGINKQH